MTSRVSAPFLLSIVLVLLAFAGNSILGRLALIPPTESDPLLYTLLRLISGSLVLLLLIYYRLSLSQRSLRHFFSNTYSDKSVWLPALYLLVYMLGFSLAYRHITAGSGALLLFGSVQLSMLLVSVYRGQRPSNVQLLGWLIALVGLIVLISEDGWVFQSSFVQAETINIWIAYGWMTAAGVGWGLYSVAGQTKSSPLDRTGLSFILASALLLIGVAVVVVYQWLFVTQPDEHWLFTIGRSADPLGILYACLSGGVTSALGYALWYRLLPTLETVQAATIQLMVPIVTALIASPLLNEAVSVWFLIAAGITTLGTALVMLGGDKQNA